MIARTVQSARAGLTDPRKPIGVFIADRHLGHRQDRDRADRSPS